MVARQDDEGFIWLMDRKNEVIITGGEIIYPLEIGELLMNHPKIRDPLRSDRLSAVVIFVDVPDRKTRNRLRRGFFRSRRQGVASP